ncbi:hypothetical protein EMPS_00885 [Entomortierella parvispora]|uniref:SET domain-containing protein n=1 Tax=Entomortierella parvispora TaxID=205924 RepID=A0A9P3H1X5_9FUNG|nr:hypothetical protein EMPS_00885 [Entomortierella parvispora]
MTTSSSSSSLVDFCSWAASQGVISSLIPKESKGKGIGLFVPANLLSTDQDQDKQNQDTDNHDLLFVPSALLLSRSKVLNMDCPPLRKTLNLLGPDLVTERLALILFLLFGRLSAAQDHHGARSIPDKLTGSNTKIFWPYIASLPEVSTPVTLEPELVRGYLAGTLLLDSVCAKRTKLEGEFEQLSGNMAIFEHWPIKPTLTDFIWADATFWSRVLSFQSQWEGVDFQDDIPDDMHMVPFLDFANHASTPNIRWLVNKDGLHVVDNGLQQQKKKSTRDAPNSHLEAFLSYGSKPNTELLFLYGFLLHDNPTQFLTLAMPMDEEDPYYMPKAHALMRLGIPPRITLYMDKTDGPKDLVELCDGLWITAQSQLLLRIYALNEEDGLSAMIEEPDIQACAPLKIPDSDEDTEEMNLDGEDTLGRLVLTISGTKADTREDFEALIPAMEIYPVLVLRGLVLVANRVEYYVSRIMETGDKVQREEDIEIVRAVNFDADHESPERGGDITDLLANVNLADDPTSTQPLSEEERNELAAATSEQLKVEAQVSCLVSLMKAYRTEELSTLVEISNYLGEAQTKCLEESPFIQAYLASMQGDAGDE